jgi:hypothetical protein
LWSYSLYRAHLIKWHTDKLFYEIFIYIYYRCLGCVCNESQTKYRSNWLNIKNFRFNNKLMGDVTFIFAGDFRETLPVITKGTWADVIIACLKFSPLWSNVEKLYLRTNMRVYICGASDIFSAELLKIVNRTLKNYNDYISVHYMFRWVVNNVEVLIYAVYLDIFNLSNKSYQWIYESSLREM